jgi:hypothetical protein
MSSEAVPVIEDDRWSVQYLGPATYVQVKGLRPGRRYAVRVACQAVVADETVLVQLAQPSDVLILSTPATPPDAPAPPGLANRARNSLKVGGCLPCCRLPGARGCNYPLPDSCTAWLHVGCCT